MPCEVSVYPDFKELLVLLNEHKVKYLVIGGYAVAIHAQPRVTKDLDVFILPAPGNAKAIFRVLAEFGAPLNTRTSRDAAPKTPRRAVSSKDFEHKDAWFTFGVPPVAVDILSEIPGVTFEPAWKNRSTQIIDTDTGLTAHFISRDDLITAKLTAAHTTQAAQEKAHAKALTLAPHR